MIICASCARKQAWVLYTSPPRASPPQHRNAHNRFWYVRKNHLLSLQERYPSVRRSTLVLATIGILQNWSKAAYTFSPPWVSGVRLPWRFGVSDGPPGHQSRSGPGVSDLAFLAHDTKKQDPKYLSLGTRILKKCKPRNEGCRKFLSIMAIQSYIWPG